MSDPIDKVLSDRAHEYDNSLGQAWDMAGKAIRWFHSLGWLDRILDSDYGFAWVIIFVKLIRILQAPTHKDSWLDIGGYAKLVYNTLDTLPKEEVNK